MLRGHCDVQSVYDTLIPKDKFNELHSVTFGHSQYYLKHSTSTEVVMTLHTLMKEYNNTLTKTVCLNLSSDDMSDYNHLVELDFIKATDSSKTMIGLISVDDVQCPHTQTFNKLMSGIYRTNILQALCEHQVTTTSEHSLNPNTVKDLTNTKTKSTVGLEVWRTMNFRRSEAMLDRFQG